MPDPEVIQAWEAYYEKWKPEIIDGTFTLKEVFDGFWSHWNNPFHKPIITKGG